MSHSRERNEANCLNCDTEVIGRFCHNCGQENIEPRESFWSLLTHFFNDITHFDGKFFKTLGTLIRKPGFLASEYVKGRRARYLHPIRMYLFTSAFFFLVFYSYTSSSMVRVEESSETRQTTSVIARDTIDIDIFSREYASLAIYDSVQRALPKAERDNWFQRKLIRRSILMNNRYKDNLKGFIKDLINGLIHSLPTLLFVSLPLFALVLKLLYSRRNFVYADHAIYLIFLYIFMFILGLSYILTDNLIKVLNAPILYLVLAATTVYAVCYSLFAMKRFYGQGWRKTITKFIVFHLLANIIIIVLFIIFLLLTFFRV